MVTEDDPFEHVRKALADWEQRAAPIRANLETFQADTAAIASMTSRLQDKFKTDELNGAIADVEARFGVTPEAKAKIAEADAARKDAERRVERIIAEASQEIERARATLSDLLRD